MPAGLMGAGSIANQSTEKVRPTADNLCLQVQQPERVRAFFLSQSTTVRYRLATSSCNDRVSGLLRFRVWEFQRLFCGFGGDLVSRV